MFRLRYESEISMTSPSVILRAIRMPFFTPEGLSEAQGLRPEATLA